MEARKRNHVDRQLSEIGVKLTREPEARCHTLTRIKNIELKRVVLGCSGQNYTGTIFEIKIKTRSDILQGQALFRGVKQLRRCLVM